MSKLNKLPVENEVIHQLAIGETQTSIAEQVGVRQPTISRFANKDEIKARLEEEQIKLAEVAPDAVQNVKDLITEMPTIPKDDIKSRELSYKASKDTLKAVGLFPTPQYAHSLTNIFNGNRQQTVISSDFQAFLDWKATHAKPIDMPEDVDSNDN
jgi:hypothetical protein